MTDTPPPRHSLPLQLAAGLFLFGALAYFGLRTAPRGDGYWLWDFGVINEASRAWMAGRNPYDEPALKASWRAEPVPHLLEHIDHVESLLPPPTLAITSPLALVPRRPAMMAWVVIQWGSLITTIAALCTLARLPQPDPRAILLAALVLLLGPVQSGVQAGQPVMPAVACIVLAILFDLRHKPIAAGVLLAIATALKLQLAAPFIVYFAFVGRWRTALTAAGAFAAISVIAVARLQLAGVPWLHDWLANVRRSTGPGGLNDFADGVATDHLLNLHLPLYAISTSRAIAKLGALAIFAMLALAYAVRLWRARDRHREHALLLVAPVTAMACLPVYHRYYDASLLVIPLAWAIASRMKPIADATLLLVAPFALPVGWAQNVVRRGYIAATTADSRLWHVLVNPLQVWLLLALSIVLIAAIPRRR
jgi:hypothetical protein